MLFSYARKMVKTKKYDRQKLMAFVTQVLSIIFRKFISAWHQFLGYTTVAPPPCVRIVVIDLREKYSELTALGGG